MREPGQPGVRASFTDFAAEARAHLPGYMNWLMDTDMVPAYRYYREVLQLLSEGHCTKDIAERLHLGRQELADRIARDGDRGDAVVAALDEMLAGSARRIRGSLHGRERPQPGPGGDHVGAAQARIRWAGINARTVSQALAHSYVSPVLTAHPTEVQRKSILDAERDIARLLTERDEIRARALPKDALAPRALAANELQLRARVLQLWQTRLLRFTKLTVADEIETSLSYYEATFLREIPKLYAHLEQELGREPTVEDVRQLMGASTPHFALQLRNLARVDALGVGQVSPFVAERRAGAGDVGAL